MTEQSAILSAAEEAAKQNRILELRGRLSSIRKKKSIVDHGDDSTSTSATTEYTLHRHLSPSLNVNSTTTALTPDDDDGGDDISDDGSTDSTMSTGSVASSIMSSGSGYDPDSFMSIDQGSLDDSFKELISSEDQHQEKPEGLLDSFLESNHRDSSRSSGDCEKENRRDCCSKDDNDESSDVSSKEQTKSKRWEEKSKELRQLRIAKMKERNKQKAAAAAQVNHQQPQTKPSPPSRPCVNNNNNNAPFVSKIHKYKKLMSGTDLYSETIRREAQRVLAQVKISHLVNEAKRIIQEADQQKAMKILLQGGDSNQDSTLLTTIHPNMLPPCLCDTEDDDTNDKVDILYYQDDNFTTTTTASDETVASHEEHMVSNEEAAISSKRKYDTLETVAHIRRQCSLEEVQFEVEMILHAVEDILKSRKGRIAWMKRKRLLLSVHHEDKDTELKMQVKHLKSTLNSTVQDEKASEDIQLDDTLKNMSDYNDTDVYEDDDNSFFAIGRDGILSGSLLDYDTDDTVQSKKKMRIKNPSWTKIRRMRRKSEVSKATSITTEGTVEMDELDWYVLNSAEC